MAVARDQGYQDRGTGRKETREPRNKLFAHLITFIRDGWLL